DDIHRTLVGAPRLGTGRRFPDFRVCLPRRQRSDPQLHHSIARRTRAREGELPMKTRKTTLRLAAASMLLATAAFGTAAIGQEAPADPTVLQPVPDDYQPQKTSWGDPDFTGTWPIDNIAS